MALKNITLAQFKLDNGVDTIDIVKSPKTGLLFASMSNGEKRKVQGNIDLTKTVEYLYDDTEDLDKGCFINPGNTGENVLGTI